MNKRGGVTNLTSIEIFIKMIVPMVIVLLILLILLTEFKPVSGVTPEVIESRYKVIEHKGYKQQIFLTFIDLKTGNEYLCINGETIIKLEAGAAPSKVAKIKVTKK